MVRLSMRLPEPRVRGHNRLIERGDIEQFDGQQVLNREGIRISPVLPLRMPNNSGSTYTLTVVTATNTTGTPAQAAPREFSRAL